MGELDTRRAFVTRSKNASDAEGVDIRRNSARSPSEWDVLVVERRSIGGKPVRRRLDRWQAVSNLGVWRVELEVKHAL